MAQRVLLGMLTPSSNTVLEPLTSAMVADLPEVSAHFERFRVTRISLSEEAVGQFDTRALVDAARLLADAHVDVIAWNGTSAGWLGFDADRTICEAIRRDTGIPATTSTLALGEAFASAGAARFGLVTPYLDEVQERIVKNFRAEGFECVAERHLNDSGNFSFSEVGEETIAEMTRAVAETKPDAITIYCTNLKGAVVAAALESELGIPIYDSVSVAVWRSLLIAGVDARRVQGWGGLFESTGPEPERYADE